MKLKLTTNEFGLKLTENKLWGILQLGPKYWQVQYREESDDPWGWEIIGFAETEEDAISLLFSELGEDE